jgi:periplasmic protein TonB
VKQIIFALILALGIHLLLLGMEFGWLRNKLADRPKPRALTMSLTHREPQKAKPKNVVKKPDIPAKKNVIPKKKVKKRKPKPIPKPKPPKKVLKPPEIEKAPEKPLSSPAPEEPEKEKEPETVKEPDDSSADFTKDITKEEISMVGDEGVVVGDVPVVREAMPLYRINPAPKYPRIARRRGYKGTVVLEVLVDRNGRVGDLRVSTSSGYKILDKAALASVKDWAFEPGMRGDQKVEMWVRVPVRFQLN